MKSQVTIDYTDPIMKPVEYDDDGFIKLTPTKLGKKIQKELRDKRDNEKTA